MSYLSLYRKYRSQTFSEIIEQQAVVQVLQNAIKFNRIAHAYIFSGPRGTGKTSLARIYAKTINCKNLKPEMPEPCNTCENCLAITRGEHMDVIEIDAASNTGVENVRELIEKVNFLPALAPFKIYIIDETHMLSNAAFNALLKTLEEPPAHVIFILATTDPQKIPVTIQSRCQRLDFLKISQKSVEEHLRTILKKEKINISEDAIRTIAKYSGGHLRDALSISDQVIAFNTGNVEMQNVLDVLGAPNSEEYLQLIQLIINKNLAEFFQNLENLFYRGLDSVRFVQDIIEIFRMLLLLKLNLKDLIIANEEFVKKLKDMDKYYNQQNIIEIIKRLSQAVQEIRYMEDSRVYIEALLYEVLEPQVIGSTSQTEKTAKSEEPKSEKFHRPLSPARETAKVEANAEPDLPKKTLQIKVEEKINETEETSAAPEEKSLENIDIISIKHNWPDIIALLKKNKMIRLAAYLMEAIPLRLEDNVIVVGFKAEHKFHFENIREEKNLRNICEFASKVIKKPVTMKCIVMDNEELPINMQTDVMVASKLFADESIPGHIKSIAQSFEGEIIKPGGGA
ncbi:MAG: DNA polymerase III subunit gamma/tau [Candidatus Margulisbacteria bacterium]|nr:DNA polymerase III subunit gamma/tau [Candidatus Margulisiibacteriota bacterium]